MASSIAESDTKVDDFELSRSSSYLLHSQSTITVAAIQLNGSQRFAIEDKPGNIQFYDVPQDIDAEEDPSMFINP